MLRLFLLLSAASIAAALIPSQNSLHHRQHSKTIVGCRPTTKLNVAPKSSPLEDEPWLKDDSYWDMLQTASKDPETFEKFIEESMERKKQGKGPVSSTALKAIAANGDDGVPKKKGKYVPIEEWEASRQNGENMSKEERLQWECQRSGNQFKQNEILRHNLKGF